MANPIKNLKEFLVKFGDTLHGRDDYMTREILRRVAVGGMILISLYSLVLFGIDCALEAKENNDFSSGKLNPSIKESDVLSMDKRNRMVKLDINNNGKFDKGDGCFFDYDVDVSNDIKSFVYIDGVGVQKPLAYKKENGEYVIYKDTSSYLKKSENLNKEFYDYMKDKKVFDLVKAEKEAKTYNR